MKKIHTSLCDILGINMPILQAPMGGTTTPEFISKIANHGALGMIPLSTYPLNRCEEMIDQAMALTNKPLGVNLVLEWDQTERLKLSLQKGIKIIWFFWGDPSPYVEMIHQHGAKVISTVGNSQQAKSALNAGVDVIIAQGWEAGGHVYGEVASMPLIPSVVDAVEGKIPVVAAGGIADGRGLAAALSLGADGVVLGTRLLSSIEAGVHQRYKDRIQQAHEYDTVYTNLFDKGWPNSYMRVLRNSTYDNWLAAGCPASGNRPGEHDIIASYDNNTPIERYAYNLPAPILEGDLEPMANYAGQSAGLVHDIKPVTEILDKIVMKAIEIINQKQRLIKD